MDIDVTTRGTALDGREPPVGAGAPGCPSWPHHHSPGSAHDPRCISLTESEFNHLCDCETLRIIDSGSGSTEGNKT